MALDEEEHQDLEPEMEKMDESGDEMQGDGQSSGQILGWLILAVIIGLGAWLLLGS